MNEKTKGILDSLASEGRLTASTVLEEATNPASPLHAHFDWNDATAAQAHRLSQARGLIRQYTIAVRVSESGAANVRALVNINHSPSQPQQTYEHRATVVGNPEKRAKLLDVVLAQIERTLLNNADLEELDPILDVVSKVRKGLRSAAAAE